MNSLRKHPVMCSIIVWACMIITLTVCVVLIFPERFGDLNTFLVAVIGILATVLGFAAKLIGASQ